MGNVGDNKLEALEGIGRSLKLLVKLNIAGVRGERSQREMILFLDSMGFTSGEIIDLLGASAATVRPTLSRAHKKK